MASPWEKGLDFTFGVALLTAEALGQAAAALAERAKVAQESAPAVWEAVLEKGRPVRESLLRNLREEVWQPIRGRAVPASLEIKALEERVAVLEQQVNPAVGASEAPADMAPMRGPTTEGPKPGEPAVASDATTSGGDTAADDAPDPRTEDAAA